MTYSPKRRVFLRASAILPFAVAFNARARPKAGHSSTPSPFAALEHTYGGRLGVCAFDTANGRQLAYRAGERFPICSTFKVMLIGAILTQSARDIGLLQRRVKYGQHDLVSYSPVTAKSVGNGLTVAELCRAAIQYSDNTAANLLMKMLGGPQAVTRFARSMGDDVFHLDRWEPQLNTAIPGDSRDTSTPAAMAHSLQQIVLGRVLPGPQRQRMQEWLCGNTTGANRIRAGVPANWLIGDKTGSGDYGTSNDLAVLWPPARAPIVLAIYYTQQKAGAKWRDDVIAAAARVAVSELKNVGMPA